jgi:purine catabolism regulator
MFLPRTLSEARLAAERVLEPVLEYDREHGTELVRTLQTYLECERSPKRAAKRLFIHNQTVNYRISRVEQLTGRTMRSTSDISELWFGLRALALSESSGGED